MAKEKICFIISPIGEVDSDIRKLSDEKYDLVYEPVLRELGYTPIRADKEITPNSISRGIVKRIIESQLVIADVSGYNSNVFYELAIRNAIKKPVIVIKEKDQKLPFDISDKRAISIDMSNNRQWVMAKDDLEKQIKHAEENPKDASESILTDFTFQIDVEQKKDDESELKLVIKDLKDEIYKSRTSQTKKSNAGLRQHVLDAPKLWLSTDENKYKKDDKVLLYTTYTNFVKDEVKIIVKNPKGEITNQFKLDVEGNGRISKELMVVNVRSEKGTWTIDAKTKFDTVSDYFYVE